MRPRTPMQFQSDACSEKVVWQTLKKKLYVSKQSSSRQQVKSAALKVVTSVTEDKVVTSVTEDNSRSARNDPSIVENALIRGDVVDNALIKGGVEDNSRSARNDPSITHNTLEH
jgi:hypothetical protein